MRTNNDTSCAANAHSDDPFEETSYAMTTVEVNLDSRFGIDEDFFSVMKKHPQVQDGGLSLQCFLTSTDRNVADFDSLIHCFCSGYTRRPKLQVGWRNVCCEVPGWLVGHSEVILKRTRIARPI